LPPFLAPAQTPDYLHARINKGARNHHARGREKYSDESLKMADLKIQNNMAASKTAMFSI